MKESTIWGCLIVAVALVFCWWTFQHYKRECLAIKQGLHQCQSIGNCSLYWTDQPCFEGFQGHQ
jgi:hypothetical protein